MTSPAPTAFRKLTDGVHILDAPQRFMGLELGARMTVLEEVRGRPPDLTSNKHQRHQNRERDELSACHKNGELLSDSWHRGAPGI